MAILRGGFLFPRAAGEVGDQLQQGERDRHHTVAFGPGGIAAGQLFELDGRRWSGDDDSRHALDRGMDRQESGEIDEALEPEALAWRADRIGAGKLNQKRYR
jgi:hypothetical protein